MKKIIIYFVLLVGFSQLFVGCNNKKQSAKQSGTKTTKKIERTKDKNPIKTVFQIDGKETFTAKQIETFTNFEDFGGCEGTECYNCNEQKIDKIYTLSDVQTFFSKRTLEDGAANKQLLFINFLINEWEDGPSRYDIYQYKLGGKDKMISIFQYPNDPTKIVCITKTNINEQFYTQIFMNGCNNAACWMEEFLFEGDNLELIKGVHTYEDFLSIHKKIDFDRQ